MDDGKNKKISMVGIFMRTKTFMERSELFYYYAFKKVVHAMTVIMIITDLMYKCHIAEKTELSRI